MCLSGVGESWVLPFSMGHSLKKRQKSANGRTEGRVSKTDGSQAFDRLPLNALRVFEAVASRLSFAEAAEALHVTAAAVSMQIKTLEDYLQVQLFLRKGRSVELTAEGERLLPGVRRGLAELQTSMQQLREDRAGGSLNISTIASFLQKWLLPRLPQFHEKYPDSDLRIHTSRQPIDFTQSNFHVAIRMTSQEAPNLYNEKLLDEWFLPVCSPQVLAKYGPLESVKDVKRFPLLRSDDEPWDFWLHPSAKRDWKESGSLFDDSLTVLAAAEQHQGYALTRWSLAAADLASGRLVRASTTVAPCPRSYYFVCPEGYLAMPKVKRLRDWLRSVSDAFPKPN
jgi:LysR family glycine cleavage system transcriptional activator